MKLLTILGTRPQYIKFKPLYDYFIINEIENLAIDTDQHYDYNVSGIFLKELEIAIDKHLSSSHEDSFSFLSDSLLKIHNILSTYKPNVVIVLGDTNTSLISSIVAYQMGIKVAHIEAGIRCGDKSRPEEMNRILIDELASFHFTSRQKDVVNVANPMLVGDLEYALLNNLEKSMSSLFGFRYEDCLFMTIHRQENTTKERIKLILESCEEYKGKIVFAVHPRTKKIIQDFNICVPRNVKMIEPLGYFAVIRYLSKCRGIVSDSGGIAKISPFFGKKCLIPSRNVEWSEVIDEGYGMKGLDFSWFNDYEMPRRKDFYYIENACERIVDTIR
jgi:UDP-GlcNAc3NAcA epimerase